MRHVRLAACLCRPETGSARGRGRYKRETSIHVCSCGHPKVPWRSRCRPCLLKQKTASQARRAQEKKRAKDEARRMFR